MTELRCAYLVLPLGEAETGSVVAHLNAPPPPVHLTADKEQHILPLDGHYGNTRTRFSRCCLSTASRARAHTPLLLMEEVTDPPLPPQPGLRAACVGWKSADGAVCPRAR